MDFRIITHTLHALDGPERRMQEDLRNLIQRHLDGGWQITARSPRLTLERGPAIAEVINGVLNFSLKQKETQE